MDQLKEITNNLEELSAKLKREVVHRLANTNPDKINREQYNSAIIAARHIADDLGKLSKALKNLAKSHTAGNEEQ